MFETFEIVISLRIHDDRRHIVYMDRCVIKKKKKKIILLKLTTLEMTISLRIRDVTCQKASRAVDTYGWIDALFGRLASLEYSEHRHELHERRALPAYSGWD